MQMVSRNHAVGFRLERMLLGCAQLLDGMITILTLSFFVSRFSREAARRLSSVRIEKLSKI